MAEATDGGAMVALKVKTLEPATYEVALPKTVGTLYRRRASLPPLRLHRRRRC